jgi:hypothetical protein
MYTTSSSPRVHKESHSTTMPSEAATDDAHDKELLDPNPMTTGVSIVQLQPIGKSSTGATHKPLPDWSPADVAAWVAGLEKGEFQTIAPLFESHGVSLSFPCQCPLSHFAEHRPSISRLVGRLSSIWMKRG